MVWEQNVYIIVMLTNCFERGRVSELMDWENRVEKDSKCLHHSYADKLLRG